MSDHAFSEALEWRPSSYSFVELIKQGWVKHVPNEWISQNELDRIGTASLIYHPTG